MKKKVPIKKVTNLEKKLRHCPPSIINQLRFIVALLLWFALLFYFFPKPRQVRERPAARYLQSDAFEKLSIEDQMHANIYACYLGDLAEDHPDLLLYKALSDQELTEFLVHGSKLMSKDMWEKYRLKAIEDEIVEYKDRALRWIDRYGEREYEALKEHIKFHVMKKVNGWPMQARKTVLAMVKYTAEFYPQALSRLPDQTVVQLINTWKKVAPETQREKLWKTSTTLMNEHQHRFHENGGDSLGRSFELHINGHEFNFSDQLKTVIAGMYGEHVAEHAHFHVDGETVNHHSLLDEWRGNTITVSYLGPLHGKDAVYMKSFVVPEKAN